MRKGKAQQQHLCFQEHQETQLEAGPCKLEYSLDHDDGSRKA